MRSELPATVSKETCRPPIGVRQRHKIRGQITNLGCAENSAYNDGHKEGSHCCPAAHSLVSALSVAMENYRSDGRLHNSSSILFPTDGGLRVDWLTTWLAFTKRAVHCSFTVNNRYAFYLNLSFCLVLRGEIAAVTKMAYRKVAGVPFTPNDLYWLWTYGYCFYLVRNFLPDAGSCWHLT